MIGIFHIKYLKLRKFKCKNSSYIKSNLNRTFLFLILLLLGAQSCKNYSLYLKTKSNKNNHTINGNISAKGSLKFMHWNKGNSNFTSKVDDIKKIIDQFSPDFFSISEANYDMLSNIKFPGYNLEYNRLHISHNIARSVVLI